jgi:hypothetical protein
MSREIQAAIRQLVDVALGERADRHLLEPALIASLTVEVRDFLKYHQVEFAEHRVRDHEILLQHPWFRPQRKAQTPSRDGR